MVEGRCGGHSLLLKGLLGACVLDLVRRVFERGLHEAEDRPCPCLCDVPSHAVGGCRAADIYAPDLGKKDIRNQAIHGPNHAGSSHSCA